MGDWFDENLTRENVHSGHDFRRKRFGVFGWFFIVVVILVLVFTFDIAGIKTKIEKLGFSTNQETQLKEKDNLVNDCTMKFKSWLEVQKQKGYDLEINKIEKFEVNQKSEAEEFYDLWSDIGGGIDSSYFRGTLNPNEESPVKYPLVLIAATYENLGNIQHVTLVFVCNRDVEIINSEFN